MRTASRFKEIDVKRAIRATQAAGLLVTRVEIDPETGKITVIAGAADGPAESTNPWGVRK